MDVDFGSSVWSLPELWIFRVGLLILMLLLRDKEANFATLKATGPGCGLVLNARQLSQALQSHLCGGLYMGRSVKRYKGTLFRMGETLAISYRWQSREQQVDGLGALNMSDWQMGELIKGIEHSRCQYVWMDRFSVPQKQG
eukprot:scaffold651398_cov46-Prasinocladus_malaysianus.AAC.1